MSGVNDQPDGIAIIGMAGRFPGATTVAEFWANLVAGVESVSRFTDDELLAAGVPPELLAEPNYVRAKGILQDIELFDAEFFGVVPKDAEVMDPQHRLFLEAAWQALEQAGYAGTRLDSLVGVFAGAYIDTYLLANLCAHPHFLRELVLSPQVGMLQTKLGNDKDYLATRVSYKLNLRGPSLTLGTACSTSLVAVIQACQALLTYQCDMALAGAVTVTVPQVKGHLYEEDGILSSDGHCRAFDARGQGTVFGSGLGVVVLKRLSDALADGDDVVAVIRGWGLNNDGGEKFSYTAPSVNGQAEAIEAAHQSAGIDGRAISYVEAHGTATPLGDPIEIAALTQAFRSSTADTGFCAIGSVKTNIGHLDVASGMAGIIKTALALRHRVLPASLHFSTPNPKIDFTSTPFFVNRSLRPWEDVPLPRRAGVSSFGVGGTNTHVILEEAPPSTRTSSRRGTQLLIVSARTETALREAAANLARHLEQTPDSDLGDVAWTLQAGRQAFAHRAALVAADLPDAVRGLSDAQRLLTASVSAEAPPVTFMFPGQGTQHPGMGRQLYETEPAYRAEIDECVSFLRQECGVDLRDVLFAASDDQDANDRLRQTSYAQPAIFVVSYALARLWLSWGIEPASLVGHSVGEFVAATLAGVMDRDDALRLVAMRGRLMQDVPEGAMLSVRMSAADVESYLGDDLDLAAANSPSLSVVAGPIPAIQALASRFEQSGVAARRLHTSHAFHSRMMDPVVPAFERTVRTIQLSPPIRPIVSTLTGRLLTAEEACDPGYWARHLRQPVRFVDAIVAAAENGGVFLEVGPGQTLGALTRQALGGRVRDVLSSLGRVDQANEDVSTILTSLGRLWLANVSIDWAAVHASDPRGRVPLPTYPFQRKRFWVDPPPYDSSSWPPAVEDATVKSSAAASAASATSPSEAVTAARATDDAPSTSSAVDADTHIAHTRTRLLRCVQELSGVDIGDVRDSATFLDLGLDSLLLTQVSRALQNEFGVKVTMRQLLDDLASIDRLSAWLAAHTSPAPAPAPASAPSRVPAVSGTAPVPSASAPAASTASGRTALEQLVADQLALMREQLRQLSGQPHAQQSSAMIREAGQALASISRIVDGAMPPSAKDSGLSAPHAAPPPGADIGASRLPLTPGVTPGATPSATARRSSALTPRQRTHLDALIARYTARTPRSKADAARHRRVHADPRTVSGFHRLWKEMVYPIVVERSSGSRLWDVDGHEYIDMLNGFGPTFLGHSPSFIVNALKAQIDRGYELGPMTPLAGEVASLFCAMTGMDRVSFVNTGSEAVQAALRLARTVTGRDTVVVFSKDYHGNFDEVLVRGVKSDAGYRSVPIAPGIPLRAVADVVVLEYGSEAALNYIKQNGDRLAAVLVEPVQSRRPEFRPVEFVRAVRELTHASGTVLIFDEVITGFRTGPGGAQTYYGVRADLATYGKVIGGGLPIGAVAGRADLMDTFDGGEWQYGDDSFPAKPVTFFAGTFVRHPLAMAAAHATLTHLQAQSPALWNQLEARTARLCEAVGTELAQRHVPIQLPHFHSQMFVRVADDAGLAPLVFYHLRERGIFLLEGFPSYLTTAHSDADIDQVIAAWRDSLAEMDDAGCFAGETATARLTSSTHPDAVSMPAASPSGSTVASVPASQLEGVRVVPATTAQREMMLAIQLDPTVSCSYNEAIAVVFDGPMRVEAMRAAVQRLADRHDALRSTFDAKGEYLRVAPHLDLALNVVDLSARPEEERQAALSALNDAEVTEPFDLFNGPLVRARLAVLDRDRHVLLFTAHHLVCDGWSLNVILADLSALYNGLVDPSSARAALPDAPSFADYAEEEDRRIASGADAEIEAYWEEAFRDPPPFIELPVDRPHPRMRETAGSTERLVLDAEVANALRSFARQQGSTTYATLLAAFGALLHRVSSQGDFCVGIPAAGQVAGGVSGLVGHCVNFLPLRLRVDGNESFDAHLSRTRNMLLDSMEQQPYTYGRLLPKLNLPRIAGRLPLVEISFNVERFDYHPRFADLSLTVDPTPRRTVTFDLFLNVIEREDGLVLDAHYLSALFDRETIQRLLHGYGVMLRSIAGDPGRPVRALPLISDDESRRLIEEWNQTQAAYPQTPLIHQLVEAHARQMPDRVAVVGADGRVNWRELNQRANLLARRLVELGAGRDRLVCLCLERSIELVIGILAAHKAGAGYVPLEPTHPAGRLAGVIKDAGAVAIVSIEALADRLPEGGPPVVLVPDEPTAHSSEPGQLEDLGIEVRPEDLAYAIYTSGSTGQPKGVAVEHRHLLNYTWAFYERLAVPADASYAVVSTVAADLGMTGICIPLAAGGVVHMIPPELATDGRALAAWLSGERVDVMKITPSHLAALLQQHPSADLLPRRCVVVAGELAQRDFVAELQRMAPQSCVIFNCYGPTETTVSAMAYRVGDLASLASASVPIGLPVGNVRAYVLDAAGAPSPVGVPGELFIGGVSVARGYLNRPELTAERFLRDPFSTAPDARMYRTGDRVRRLADGNIEFLGRLDHQIKIRGFRVELGEIEATLMRHPDVRQCVVVAREHTQGDLRLIAYVETQTDPAPIAELRRFLKDALPDYMVPAFFVPIREWPLNPNGKLDRAALPAYVPSREEESAHVAPRTETEQALAAIWSEVLRVDQVSLDDDFFALGGHSLLALKVASRIHQVFNAELSTRTVFTSPILRDLARAVETARSSSSLMPQIQRREGPGPWPLSFGQERLWFIDKMTPAGAAYNVVTVIRFDGDCRDDLVERAVIGVVRRHESLRTTFTTVDGQPVQQVQADATVSFRRVDLSERTPARREEAWAHLLQEETCGSFELSQAPLVRAVFVHLTSRVHALIVSMPHIVSDEWSLDLLHAEIKDLYAAAAANVPDSLDLLPIQYADFAVWQREWLRGARLEQQLAYWREELRGAPARLELPIDRPRPAVQTFRGALHRFRLPDSIVAPLDALGRDRHATRFMVLMASFIALLHRWSGQNDVVVGTPISGRQRRETEDLIGFFLNTVVVRTEVEDASFRDLIDRVRTKALGAYAHQDVPFEQVVSVAGAERSLGHTPLFQVMFILSQRQKTSSLSDVVSLPWPMDSGTSKFDLTLLVDETDGHLDALFEYNSDVFEPETIERLAATYRTLLAGLVDTPDQSIAAVPVMSEAERREIVEYDVRAQAAARTTGRPAVEPGSLGALVHEAFERQVARTPDATALVYGSVSMTYAELDRRATQLANHLRGLGAGPDVRVGLLLERTPDLLVGVLAILKAGAAYVPVEPSYPADRIASILEQATAPLLVTQTSLASLVPSFTGQRINLDVDWPEIARAATPGTPVNVAPGHLAYVLFTSGSTGKPKGVAVEHAPLIAFLEWTHRIYTREELAGVLFTTSICFDISVVEIFTTLTAGGTIILLQNALHIADAPASTPITMINTVPSVMAELLRASGIPASVKTVSLAGEALPAPLVEQIYASTAVERVHNLYGPTESTVYSTHTPVRRGEPVTIGQAIDGTRSYILDRHRSPVPLGVTGELFLAGRGLARGYLGRPDLTEERFVPDPFYPGQRMYRTGDLARRRSDGAIEYLGRIDDQVKLRGFRIELGEIEAVLSQHPDVRRCVVLVRGAGSDGRLVAYVEPHPGSRPATAALHAHIARSLPNYMIPAQFMLLDAWPLMSNGKLNRKALPAPEEAIGAAAEGATMLVPPRTLIERRLSDLWTELLGVEQVGVNDDFFKIGGHSLLAMRLLHRIHQDFGVSLRPGALFEHRHLADLARLIERDVVPVAAESSLVRLEAGGPGPALFWLPGIDGEAFTYMRVSRHLAPYTVYALAVDWGRMANGHGLTIEAMAARCVREIRAVQPSGPYHIGGYCAAARLALEVVHQLEAAGQEVGVFAAIDYDFSPRTSRSWIGAAGAFLRNLPFWVRDDVAQTSLPELPRRLWSRVRRVVARYNGRSVDVRDRLGMWRIPDYRVPVLEANFAAIRRHTPKAFGGRAHLFIARTAPLLGPWNPGHDPMWNQLAKSVETHVVRGSHSTMIAEPFAAELGRILKTLLDEAARQHGTPEPVEPVAAAAEPEYQPAAVGSSY
jgi:amino acid adenylation domain-containing protein